MLESETLAPLVGLPFHRHKINCWELARLVREHFGSPFGTELNYESTLPEEAVPLIVSKHCHPHEAPRHLDLVLIGKELNSLGTVIKHLGVFYVSYMGATHSTIKPLTRLNGLVSTFWRYE